MDGHETTSDAYFAADALPAVDSLRIAAQARGLGQDESLLVVLRSLRLVWGDPSWRRQVLAAAEPFAVRPGVKAFLET